MNKARIFSIFSLIMILSGCLRARYQAQPVCVPEKWRFEASEASTLCNYRWWEQFDDEVLNKLVFSALENNLNVKVAIYRVKEYYARMGTVSSFLFPTVDGVGDYDNIQSSLSTPIPVLPGIQRVNNNYDLMFTLNWELDLWSRVLNNSDASYMEWLGQVEARRSVVLALVTSVADTYITLRSLDAQLVVSKYTLESRQRALEIAQLRFETGETSYLEVTQADAEVEDAKIAVIILERAIPQVENLLSVLIGETPQDIPRGLDINGLAYPLEIPAGIPSELLTRRPDIVEAEDLLIASNSRVWAARADLFPRFSLTGLFGSQSDQLKEFLTYPSQMWVYGINAAQPIFNAGRNFFQIEEAKAIRNEALYRYRQTILNALQEVNDALIKILKNKELVLERQQQVKVLKEYRDLANLRYMEGEVDYLNVLDAERKFFDAQLLLIQAQADSFTSIVLLYGALGGGWVIDADSIALESSCSVSDN